MRDSTDNASGERTVEVTVPARLADALDRSPGGWDRLMGLVDSLGDGNAALGLDGVVGIVRAVLSQRALETSPPWTRTLAASQAECMTDDEILFAFRLDGSQMPRLAEFRTALRDGIGTQRLDGVDAAEVTDAEWLLRNMGIRSNLTGQFDAYRARVAEAAARADKARRSLASALVIPSQPEPAPAPVLAARPDRRRPAGAVLH